jgi:ABC-2 type transport system ATP-binding protein
MIQVHSLSKNFNNFLAVDQVSFEVQKGEVLGFLGPNGAGKSTTMKMLTCFIPPSSGTAEICGFSILENAGWRVSPFCCRNSGIQWKRVKKAG